MKKIAQGRERRKNRQLDAAERELVAAQTRLKTAQQTLALREKEAKHAKGAELLDLQRGIESWKASIERGTLRLQKAEERLSNLRAGNYPA